jgi:hypothetical protein
MTVPTRYTRCPWPGGSSKVMPAGLYGNIQDFLKKGFTACEPFFMVHIKLSTRRSTHGIY